MRKQFSKFYRCPATGAPLSLEAIDDDRTVVQAGTLVSDRGARYPIVDGIPDLSFPNPLPETDRLSRQEYDRGADNYDDNMAFTFETFGEDERAFRERMVSELHLSPNARVLETGAGSGRDTALIVQRLGSEGLLCVQDLSLPFLKKAVAKLMDVDVPIEYSVANASYLPFADNFFDATYHFGGINTFGDIGRAFREAVRVTRAGGRVVIGDEGLAPWLRGTEYAEILINGNPLYGCEAPLASVPPEACNTVVQWLLGSAFYLISFDVGEGMPEGNFNVPIPGDRGGTFNTRYFGALEGVSPEVKELAWAACRETGKSMSDWLNETLREATERKRKP
jgi:ubiquinone/menaquinone biosynthesis C-methylase UbiE/uncharacterized protein YbaR (Trm112 family)